MLDIALVGTGGMMPLPNRFLSSALIRYNGELILIDCGECTQVSLNKLGWGFKQINTICFTHFHADHIAGLPGLLLTIGNSAKTEPMKLIGPKYLKHIVKSLCVITPLPFELEFYELSGNNTLFKDNDLTISTLPVEHWVDCFAYRFDLKRKGKFDVDKAKALQIPVKYWSKLQNGETIKIDDKTFMPSDVMGKSRKGISITYSTDMRPSDRLSEFAKKSDLFICEGMYADEEKLEKAISKKHCMFSEAAYMAKKAEVKEMWLTHFSPSLSNPSQEINVATDIFKNTVAGYDHLSKEINFE